MALQVVQEPMAPLVVQEPGSSGTDGVDGDRYTTESNTCLTLPIESPNIVQLTGETGLSWIEAQDAIVVSDINNYFNATVQDYDPITGGFTFIILVGLLL